MFANAYLIIEYNKHKLFYIFSFIFIAISGLFIARVILVSIFLSIIFIFYLNIKKISYSKIIVYLVKIFVSLILIFFIIDYFSLNISSSTLLNQGLELFINYFESGELRTSSTDRVNEMLIFPNDVLNLLFGEGRFSNADGSFYKSTDVGYSRLIFYFGIFGCIIYFLPHFYITKYLKKLKIVNLWSYF